MVEKKATNHTSISPQHLLRKYAPKSRYTWLGLVFVAVAVVMADFHLLYKNYIEDDSPVHDILDNLIDTVENYKKKQDSLFQENQISFTDTTLYTKRGFVDKQDLDKLDEEYFSIITEAKDQLSPFVDPKLSVDKPNELISKSNLMNELDALIDHHSNSELKHSNSATLKALMAEIRSTVLRLKL
jgi:hypothetical protein